MTGREKCRYMAAAYPTLSADETCGDHRHDDATFVLARRLAERFQKPDPSDEQIGWFLVDANCVIEEFEKVGPLPATWSVSELRDQPEAGLDFAFSVNNVEFVVPPSEWEPSHPILLTVWREWHAEGDDDE